LPLGQLEGVPQPVALLLEVLLEKDPAQRFQTPSELVKVMPMITDAIDLGREITHQSLWNTPPTVSRAGALKSLARLRPEKISVARLPVTGSDLFGREEDIAFLDDAWANQHINVVRMAVINGRLEETTKNATPLRVQRLILNELDAEAGARTCSLALTSLHCREVSRFWCHEPWIRLGIWMIFYH
jgi:hypothetical protein